MASPRSSSGYKRHFSKVFLYFLQGLINKRTDFLATQGEKYPQAKPFQAPLSSMTTSAIPAPVGVNFASGQVDRVQNYFTVDPDDPIVGQWHLLRPDVIDVVKDLPWALLSVVRVSYCLPPPKRHPETDAIILDSFECPEPRPETNAIILVGAPAQSHVSWRAMAEKVYSLCRNANVEHTRVLFEPTHYPLTMTDLFEPSMQRNPDIEELAENVPMGSSFGPAKDAQNSASMGGAIKLQGQDEKPLVLFLSVFHPFSNLVNSKERWYGWRCSSARAIELTMPSIQDANGAREYCRKQIDQADLKITENNNKFAQIGEERYQQNVAYWKKELGREQKYIQRLDCYTSGNQGLGFLQYGSGFESGCDWSLSSFDTRKINNTPPTKENIEVSMSKTGMSYADIHQVLQGYDYSTEAKLSDPKIESFVTKRGRSTGLTVGKVNTLPSDLLISESLDLKKVGSFEVRPILGGHSSAFLRKGDSGAWVLNMEGNWIGSIIGEHSPEHFGKLNFALVVEADKIVKDIERVTSKKVVSPRRSGN
ncbi:MAG: hypothetical protein Q9165_001881 [Trypethelium subeluteriae]